MSLNFNKVNMSLDEIINNQRSQKKPIHVVKFNNTRDTYRGNERNDRSNYIKRGFNRRQDINNVRDRRRINRGGMNHYNNFDNKRRENGYQRIIPRTRFNDRRNFRNKLKNSDRINYRRLHVSNLHKDIINSELKNIFSRIGPLKRCGIHWDSLGNSKGTADVEYRYPDHAQKAIEEFNNAEIDGVAMKVKYAKGVIVRTRLFKRRLGKRSNRNGNRYEKRNFKQVDI